MKKKMSIQRRHLKRLIFFLSVVLSSCEKEIAVTPPAHTPRLVINSMIFPGDTISVRLSRSVSILQSTADLVVANGTLQLLENGTLKETLQYDPASGTYRSETVAKAGREYSLRASAPSFEQVSVDCKMPELVPLSGVSYTPNARSNSEGEAMDELKLSFQDPGTAGDKYLIRFIHKLTTSTGTRWVVHNPAHGYDAEKNVISLDPSLETTDPEDKDPLAFSEEEKRLALYDLLMQDQFFNGSIKEVKLYVPQKLHLEPHTYPNVANNNLLTSDTTFVELCHIPEACFLYLKSKGLSDYNSGDGFAEPVNVYSNVVNGYGIFSLINGSRKAL